MNDAAQSLLRAARDGDLGAMRSALAEGAGASPDALGQALLEAARAGHALAASYLLDQGADVNFFGLLRDKREILIQETPLSAAARWGALEVAHLLLDRGANLLEPVDALLAAVKIGNLQSVELLLDRGAPVNRRETQENAENGADYDIRHSPALREACEEGHLEIARLLIARGALLEIEGADPGRGWSAWAPLAMAAFRGQADACRLLLEAGANPNANNGQAMHSAAQRGQTVVIEVLLEYGADPIGLDVSENGQSYSAIGSGAAGLGSDAVLLLLERVGFAQNFLDEALWEAANSGAENLVRELLPRGANPNVARLDGPYRPDCWVSALGAAVGSCDIEIVRLMLEHDADPNAPRVSPNARLVSSPLAEALRLGEAETIQLLLEAGADPTLLSEEALAGGGPQAAALIREAARQKREGSSHE